MAALWTEDWAGADGSPWPGRWVTTGSTPSSPDLQGGAGRQRTGGAAFDTLSQAVASGEPASVDYDITLPLTVDDPLKQAIIVVAVRQSAAWSYVDPVTGYWVDLEPTSGQYVLHKTVDFGETTLGAAGHSFAAGASVWIRLYAVGADIKVKVWDDGDTEPGWGVEATDGDITDPGYVGLSILPAENAVCTALWGSLAVTDGAAAAFSLSPASESDEARPLGRRKRFTLGTALEVASARPLRPTSAPVPGRLSTSTGPLGTLAAATRPVGSLSTATGATGSLSTSTGV